MYEYTVQLGDTLPGVALKILGNSSRWDEISRLNNLVGPVELHVGQKLLLPPNNYTEPPAPFYWNNSPSISSPADKNRPAWLIYGRGFMFFVFEQLPEVGVAAGKIIRKVAIVPKNFALDPATYAGALSPAEHALNMNPKGSQFLSASDRAFGSPSIVGKSLLLDIAKIEAAGGRVITVAELVADLQRYVTQNPTAGQQVQKLIWAVEKIEGEVLITGGTPAGSGSVISGTHTNYIQSAEELWQAFRSGKINKAELEESLVLLEKAYSKARVVGKVGRVLMVVGIVFTAIDLGIAGKKSIDQKSFKPITAETIRQVGGWGGAIAGAKIGAVAGAAVGVETGPGLIVTGAIGAIVFGAAGYFGADWIADQISPN